MALLDADAYYKAGTEKSVTVYLMKGNHLMQVYFKKRDKATSALSLKWGKKDSELNDISTME